MYTYIYSHLQYLINNELHFTIESNEIHRLTKTGRHRGSIL